MKKIVAGVLVSVLSIGIVGLSAGSAEAKRDSDWPYVSTK